VINILISGVGGQGTVLASKLIAAAALRQGFDVRTTETIGMAQRGGSVTSHVRIGGRLSEIFSPIIPLGQADAIIAFEPAEAVRQLPFLSAKGRLLVCDTAIKPAGGPGGGGPGGPVGGAYEGSAMIDFLRGNVANLIVIGGDAIMKRYAKALNVALLGAAAEGGLFPFGAEILLGVLPETVPERFVEMNVQAFELGRSLYKV